MGRGCAKRGRGSGEKGGKGAAGGHKQKWSYVLRYEPEHFGKHGFHRPGAPPKGTVVNVGEIDEKLEELLKKRVAKEESGKFLVDASKLGVEKVLGGGQVAHPLEVTAKGFSTTAKHKLEAAGGKAVEG
jgi:large subunit ribosomal protein L15